ncbi:tryptophan synthase subunit alpha [Clostridium sp. P21]|uniref:Tryptophan synthase alpha chain n=1 Tax=Clostridium muellerianum TaxID=2716538 RepID=A0A7Y0HQ15_9CLOT|nr:tryptophan synthase subunit alpha [Clostridium muellerianum]NMM63646.1 tryptophan synthase subunit alpha [Clostridium muellerianum]
MNRIDFKFTKLKEKEEKALIPFITAGDPNLDTTIDIVLAMEEAGADIIELGIPYSDPLADGVTIQASSNRALKNGAKIVKIMDTVKRIREKTQIPLVYLVYYNSIFKYGMEKFIKESSDSGIDGIIIPDLPIEERKDIIGIGEKYDINIIPLVAPTSKDRIKNIVKDARGFVYCVSVNGVTGTRNDISTNVEEYMSVISEYTNLPKALGFGISSPEMAAGFKSYCEGIIVGSGIIKKIENGKSKEDIISNVRKFIRELKMA